VEGSIMTKSANPRTPPKPEEDRPHDRERLSLLARLAGSVAHAMQSPFTTILLHADVLAEELRQLQDRDQTQLLDSLRVIRAEVTRLHDLAEQYLLLSRLPELPRESEEVGTFLASLGREIKGRVAPRGITLHLEGQAEGGRVAMHEKALRRATLHLLDWLVEPTAQGGSLTLRARQTTAAVHLEMSYTGAGFPPERLSQLLQAAPPGELDQSGLGVFLAREIIATHGGALKGTSQPGTGVTITVILPLAAP
jgi:signal transduction histidine kinase